MARLPRFPDLLTTANLACGVGSILLASQGQLTAACWLVFAGALFDVFDGLAARALGGSSPLGAQLDSLADMVTFGVAPAFLVFQQGTTLAGNMLIPDIAAHLPYPNARTPLWPTLTATLTLVIASCWRLAKFNLDTRQTTGFLGLPTPANGLLWVSIVMASAHIAVHPGPGHHELADAAHLLLASPYALLIAALVLAALMLSELPFPGLKFKHFRWPGNQVIYLLGSIGAVLVVLYGILAVPLILVLYILSPLWGRLFKPQVASDK
ncbi:MAG: CDP-alcohol phosphatidyltransferase family protein [Flavobacteriales bacterium]